MTSDDAALAPFTISNGARVFAYVPQIIKIWTDREGAAAISYTTWLMFALSHATTVVCALLVVEDRALARILGVNAAFCTIIVLRTLRRRRQFARPETRRDEIVGGALPRARA